MEGGGPRAAPLLCSPNSSPSIVPPAPPFYIWGRLQEPAELTQMKMASRRFTWVRLLA